MRIPFRFTPIRRSSIHFALPISVDFFRSKFSKYWEIDVCFLCWFFSIERVTEA
jgi:hypothetical protein